MIDYSSEDSIDPELRILGRSHWQHLLMRERPHPYEAKRREDASIMREHDANEANEERKARR